MTRSNLSSKLSFKFKTSLALSAALLIAPTQVAFAQDAGVVSPQRAAAVQAAVDPLATDLDLSGENIRQLDGLNLSSDIDTPAESYSDETRPVLELDASDNTDFALGAIDNAPDTADGRTRRDPYSVENIELSPIYPEGQYVDTMETDVGVGVTSKF